MNMVINETDRLLVNHPTTELLDAYRAIRTNLLARLRETDGKTILVTSTHKNEKKSNVAVNLATSIAALGYKVLLMDCDLRTPQIAYLLPHEDTRGLSDYLEHDAEISSITNENVAKNLSVIYAGSPLVNANELLNDGKMAKLLDTLRGDYDYIVLDTSPVQEVPDALVFADKCDGVVLVARKMVTRHPRMLELVKQFASLKANIVGFVLTQ